MFSEADKKKQEARKTPSTPGATILRTLIQRGVKRASWCRPTGVTFLVPPLMGTGDLNISKMGEKHPVQKSAAKIKQNNPSYAPHDAWHRVSTLYVTFT